MADMPLMDSFGRQIRYLRVSVTDRCNYRCSYCRPATGSDADQRDQRLTDDELVRLIAIFGGLGVSSFRLTGGEPLLRPGIADLARRLASLTTVADLSLSTNGFHLDRLAIPLHQAGIRRVNISLDSLDPHCFNQITRGGDLVHVLRGIDAALAAGLKPVKVNMVVMRGVNQTEIPAMVAFAQTRGVLLRFIESMPIGEINPERLAQFVPAEEIRTLVESSFGSQLILDDRAHGAGPARYYRLVGSDITIGIISALSQHFCETCNRMRLTSRGALVLCLGQQDRVELRPLLRSDATNEAIAATILAAVKRKPQRHRFDAPQPIATELTMSSLGG